MTQLNRIRGRLDVNYVFTCFYCHATAIGTTRSLTVDAANLETFCDAILKHANAFSMPYGWTSFYRGKGDVFVCPECESKMGGN